MDDELNTVAAALAASSATQRKWASFILLGPLMPSMLAIMIIVVGGAVVKVIAFVAWNLTKSPKISSFGLEQTVWEVAGSFFFSDVYR